MAPETLPRVGGSEGFELTWASGTRDYRRMPIGITEEHEHLRTAVRRFVDDRIDPGVLREALEATTHERPAFWDALTEPGWIGLHVDEAHGGSGVGPGRAGRRRRGARARVRARPLRPDRDRRRAAAGRRRSAADRPSPRLASGELTAAVALDGATLVAGGSVADVIVCAVEGAWYALDAAAVGAKEVKSIDLTRRLARIDRNADGRRAGRARAEAREPRRRQACG